MCICGKHESVTAPERTEAERAVMTGPDLSHLRPGQRRSRERDARVSATLEFMADELRRTGRVQSDDEATPEQREALRQMVADAQADGTYTE
jgi:cell division protein FtsN